MLKIIFWSPTWIKEFLKSRLMKPTPSSDSTREIEHALRNEARLLAYKTKRLLAK